MIAIASILALIDPRDVLLGGIYFLPILTFIYDARPLIRWAVGRIELCVCSVIAVWPLCVWVALIFQDFASCGFQWSSDVYYSLALSLMAAIGLIGTVYGLHWGIPMKWLSPIVLRLGTLTWTISVLMLETRGIDRAEVVLLVAISAIYLTGIILYARSGWKERTLNEKL